MRFSMADYIYKDGELMHYGVPGMRWGFRKKSQPLLPWNDVRAVSDRMAFENQYLEAIKNREKTSPNDERKRLEARRKELLKNRRHANGLDFTLRVLKRIGSQTISNISEQLGAKDDLMATIKIIASARYDSTTDS